jgi:hypothetical protein
MRVPALPIALAALVMLAGCENDSPSLVSPEDLPLLHLEPVGAPIQVLGFSGPESMVHDPVADLYFVSNVNGHPQILSNDGFISRVAPDGSIDELHWIQGGESGVILHAPTGMVLVGDVLYVADADAVRLFDRASGAPLAAWTVPLATEEVPGVPGVDWVRGALLNGMCSGPRGEVYVTATGMDISLEFDLAPTGQDAVFRFHDGVPVPIAQGGQLAGPNGCEVVGSNVYVAPLFSPDVYRLNPSGRQFHVATLPQGGLDGLIRVDGSLFVSAVFGGSIYRISLGGSDVTEVMSGLVTPADLGFDHTRNTLLIPSLFGDFLLLQPMD